MLYQSACAYYYPDIFAIHSQVYEKNTKLNAKTNTWMFCKFAPKETNVLSKNRCYLEFYRMTLQVLKSSN